MINYVYNKVFSGEVIDIYGRMQNKTRFIAHLREGLSIPFLQIIFAYTCMYTYIRVCHIFLKAKNQ